MQIADRPGRLSQPARLEEGGGQDKRETFMQAGWDGMGWPDDISFAAAVGDG